MSITLNTKIISINAEDFIWDSAKEDSVALRWLGQAGFQIFYKNYHVMIDPYLSDHLAKKYAGKEFPHNRMNPSPLTVSEINDLDFILCTHRHSDHMDPEALPELLKLNPACKLIAPRAETEQVKKIGIDSNRTFFVNDGENIELAPGISLDVIPSAHEALKADENGSHYCLGYILKLGNLTIYHSGDCVPYPGLTEGVKRRKIDIALLPVNGRDEHGRSRGVPGNFSLEESLQLCKNAGIPVMICHHFGMFEFNTVDVNELKANIEHLKQRIQVFLPDTNKVFVISN